MNSSVRSRDFVFASGAFLGLVARVVFERREPAREEIFLEEAREDFGVHWVLRFIQITD
jgi:hypothetical protein